MGAVQKRLYTFDDVLRNSSRQIRKKEKQMSMNDTVFAELDCPFCGKQYRHHTMTWEEAESELKHSKQFQLELRQQILRGEKIPLVSQELWASLDDFSDVDLWIAQIDSSENIEAYRMQPQLGLAEIPTQEFDCLDLEFYIGSDVPTYSGHFYIPGLYKCAGCSSDEENVLVKVWLEIKDRKLTAVLVQNLETGLPEKEIHPAHSVTAPPLEKEASKQFMESNGIQAIVKINQDTWIYTTTIISLDEYISFDGRSYEELQQRLDIFVTDYFHLIGKKSKDGRPLHDHLMSICRHLSTDYIPFGERERGGLFCSSGCIHFIKLPGKPGMEWGVCSNPASPRSGLLTHEHQGCLQFEREQEDNLDP
jgi:hypothetical protein